jgi:hypothetical protein
MTFDDTPESRPNDGENGPPGPDDLARQRQRLAQFLGRLLARRWLSQQQGRQKPPDDNLSFPNRQ